MFDLQITFVKSSEIVLLLTVANVSMGGFVSLFKTSVVELIKIEVTVYGYVAYWKIAPTTDVLQRKSFDWSYGSSCFRRQLRTDSFLLWEMHVKNSFG